MRKFHAPYPSLTLPFHFSPETGSVELESRYGKMESQTPHQNQNVMNLKNLIIWLVLLSACVCSGRAGSPHPCDRDSQYAAGF